MPLPLFKKFQEARVSRQLRKQAWLGQDLPGMDGLTPFQRNAVAGLQSEFPGIEFSPTGAKEPYLRGAVPGADAVFFIYKDGAELQVRTTQFRAERWDYESPSALVTKLVFRGREALRSN